MPTIEIKNLSKHYQSAGSEVKALDEINLRIESDRYHTLLGPSGCGKTTLLRAIAGLLEPTSGSIKFNSRDVTGLPAQERDIGFVFQNFAIFPHLDVWHNTAYGPTIKGWPKDEVRLAVEQNLKMVSLYHRAKAMPSELSGGMKQRLGLARALATRGKILLLDEPLSALDAKISEFLRYELKRIAGKHNITAIHVTHNQEEAMTISDNIILMKKGRVVQTGSPEELYNSPNSIFTANFIGKCNFFVDDRIDDYKIKYQDTFITIAKPVKAKQVVVGVRPEKLHLSGKSDYNNFTGTIELINFLGHLYEYQINCGGVIYRAYKRIKDVNVKEKYKLGDTVNFWFYPEDCFAWPAPVDIKDELSLE
jgi:ABC-type Fe3+/spermidine/putrescine transport system ATPase subunit